MRFLISFGMCQKSTKNEKSSALERPKEFCMVVLGRVGGRGGRPGKGFGKVLLELDTGIRHASNSRLKTGSADLKATASAADPS